MAQPQPFAPSLPLDTTVTHQWSPLSWEARLVAGSLRTSPVTLVHGADTAELEAFLGSGVMPLLGRRREDRAASTRHGRLLPFPDRRHALGRGPVPAELVLLIDDWGGRPLPSLADQIGRALALNGTDGADDDTPGRVLLIMRGFEEALDSASASLHPDRFWDELAEAAGMQPNGLHLLLLTPVAVTPALRWLCGHAPGLGDHALALQPSPSVVNPQLTSLPDLLGRSPVSEGVATSTASISDREWLEAVQQAALRAGAEAEPLTRSAPLDDTAAVVRREPSVVAESVDGGRSAFGVGGLSGSPLWRSVAGSAPLDGRRQDRQANAYRPKLLPILAVVACIGVAVIWWSRVSVKSAPTVAMEEAPGASEADVAGAAIARSQLLPPTPTPTQQKEPPPQPPPQPQSQPQPQINLQPTPPSRLSQQTVGDAGTALRAVLARWPLIDLRDEPAQATGRLAAPQPPTLAVIRYDTLQKLPASAGLERLRVVAPLFVEPVQVWVRAESPMHRLDDLHQSVIDVGSRRGDAASAAGVTEALFGKPVPASRLRRLADDAALAALQRGDVDAVWRVEASPLTALATASVSRGSLRALTLDPTSAAGVRAMRHYLAASSPGAATGDRTLGLMSFLVVQGSEGGPRQRLAAEALGSLCSALPALTTEGGQAWQMVRPDVQLPAGLPYAVTTGEAAACASGERRPVDANPSSSHSSAIPSKKGIL